MASGGRNNSRGFFEDGLSELVARPPKPGEYFGELLKLEFMADEAQQVMRQLLPSGDVLSSRQEVLAQQAAIEKKFNDIKEDIRKAEMAVGASRIKLIQFEGQFKQQFPRLAVVLKTRYVPEEDMIKWKIQVAHKELHEYLIDEEEDDNVFPSEYLLARMALVG